ncbi:MAG: transposase [Spirochaetia bacterium]|nr:transposase [Spirochaetia bacterium]
MPKIKSVKLDLLNKKDLNKFLKSKEFKESKIAEELIVDYISSVKQSSPAKKMLLINKEIFSNGNIFQIKENSYTKKENSFMEYKLKEKTVSRNINNDRVFPKVIEKQLTEITKDDEMENRLLTIRGCGKITAWTIRAYTEDITRFASAKKYAAFCGLVPWVQDSNETIHHGKITNQCKKTA